MADRIGVIAKGELVLVEEKTKLMRKLGKRQLKLMLIEPMATIPPALSGWRLALKSNGNELEYTFDAQDGGEAGGADLPGLLHKLGELNIGFKDLSTRESSLEEIFVDLVHERTGAPQ
jgi:ABC-2 type transport system ATP-binding protein